MVKIRKGNNILVVSNCTYRDMFKRLGYELVEESEGEVIETSPADNTELNEIEDKLVQQEQEENKSITEEEGTVNSSDLNVNIIGENLTDFDQKEIETKVETENVQDISVENSVETVENSTEAKVETDKTENIDDILGTTEDSKTNKPKRK